MNTSIKQHQKSFDKIYKDLKDFDYIKFPLEEFGRIYYFYKIFTQHIHKMLELKNNMSILHIGCGQGMEERNIDNMYNNVIQYSIDISQEMIKKAVMGNSSSHFSIAQSEKLPFPDNSFDRIVSREVIEHVMNPEKMISEIKRCLKPGGRAVVTTEYERSLLYQNLYFYLIKNILKFNLRTSYKDESPTLNEMKNYSKKAGLFLDKIYWDGALYKTLDENIRKKHKPFKSEFQKKLFNFSCKYFSVFEGNNKFFRYFCDQIKFVLIKPDDKNYSKIDNIEFICPKCRNSLDKTNKSLYCFKCNLDYKFVEDTNVPDFISTSQSSNNIASTENLEKKSNPLWKKVGFRLLYNFIIKYCYSYLYLILAGVFAIFPNLFKKATH